MSVLVVYGSRYGATRGIAERIGETLRACGHEVDVREASPVLTATAYDAFVIGSAAYRGSWLEGPVDFVMRHVDVLAERPVWLFSSGPLGTSTTDDDGHPLVDLTRPRQFDEFEEALLPRDMRVFFGALDPARLDFRDRMARRPPAGRRLLPAGDFRDWGAVDAWARDIGAHIPGPATKGTPS